MTRLVVSHYMPADHGTHVDFILPWISRVQAACPSLEFEVHCEGHPLGLLENQFSQVSSGVVDIAHSPASLPPGRFPLTNLMNLPFLVEDSQQASDRLWKAHATFLKGEFAPLHVLALHADSGGVLHMRDTRVRSLDDLSGKRIRTPVGAIADTMRATGAEAVHLLPPAIGQAARNGEIDGAIMAWDVLAYTGTQDIFRHHYEDVFYVSPLYLVMNPDSYAGLTSDERQALDNCSGADLTPRFGAYWKTWSAPGRALAQEEGHSFERLPSQVMSGLRAAATESIRRHVNRSIEGGLVNASEIIDLFYGNNERR